LEKKTIVKSQTSSNADVVNALVLAPGDDEDESCKITKKNTNSKYHVNQCQLTDQTIEFELGVSEGKRGSNRAAHKIAD
jgi:hypothetical protein